MYLVIYERLNTIRHIGPFRTTEAAELFINRERVPSDLEEWLLDTLPTDPSGCVKTFIQHLHYYMKVEELFSP